MKSDTQGHIGVLHCMARIPLYLFLLEVPGFVNLTLQGSSWDISPPQEYNEAATTA